MVEQVTINNPLKCIIKAFKNDLNRISFQDAAGTLLYISKKIAYEFGHNDVEFLENKHYSLLQNLESAKDLQLANKLQKQIQKGEVITNVIYNSHANIFYLQANTPIYDDEENFIAWQSIYSPTSMQVIQQLYRLRYLTRNKEVSQILNHNKKLTELQEMVLFLLLADKSQTKMAKILNYSRSNITKNVKALHKIFGLKSKENNLREHCFKNGYDQFIPKQLLTTKVSML